ncbi:heavy-metal-associated domain-containing protein [Candidatus Poribacteria bacterium]|nr:heavy-metal-associated domain-containing protein [Candidatus Poribacteria bacterium]
MQGALEEVPGVSSVQMDMLTRKAIVQIQKGKVTDDQLVNAVSKANGMHEYSATVIQLSPSPTKQ